MARSTKVWQRDSCGVCVSVRVSVCVCVHVCRWKGRKQRGQVHEVKQGRTWLVRRMCVPSLRTTSPTRARKIWDYRGCVCSCRAGLCFQQLVKCWTSETLRAILIPPTHVATHA